MAASSDTVRRDLVALTHGAHFDVRSVAADPATLARLLRSNRGAWVVTGGTLPLAQPFLHKARSAHAAVVAVLAGRMAHEGRSKLDYGGLALLRALPPTETFQAAVEASRAGLSVWDPGLCPLTEPATPGEPPLSPRERRVLELAADGLSNKAVARRLGISPNTVKFHLQAAFEKLGVASRTEAIMAAIRRGDLSV